MSAHADSSQFACGPFSCQAAKAIDVVQAALTVNCCDFLVVLAHYPRVAVAAMHAITTVIFSAVCAQIHKLQLCLVDRAATAVAAAAAASFWQRGRFKGGAALRRRQLQLFACFRVLEK